jgi:CRISPR-associated protein Cmr6
VLLSAAEVLAEAEAALWLLTHFGAVGSKSRKGFGSLQAEFAPALSLDLAGCASGAAQLRQRLGLVSPFDLNRMETSALDDPDCRTEEVETPWLDPWQALDQVGFVYQAFAQRYAHDAAKAALGLPRKIHGPRDDGPMGGQRDWQPPEWLDFPRRPQKVSQKDARHASPLHIHLEARPDGRLVVRLICFPSRDLPDRVTSIRVLCECLDHFRQELQRRGQDVGPQRTATRPVAPTHTTAVTVRVLERRPDLNKKPCFRVQEEGGRPGILNDGVAPPVLPEVGAEIEVYRANTDRNSPRYRWDPAPPPSQRPPRGRR